MSAEIKKNNNGLILTNQFIKVEIDINNCFCIKKFVNLKTNQNYGQQEEQLLIVDRTLYDLSKPDYLTNITFDISDINDSYQTSGKQVQICYNLKNKSDNIKIIKNIFLYDNAGALRIYDEYSSKSNVAGLYYSDIQNFTFSNPGKMRCVDFFTCTDQSNNRLIEKEVKKKNKGNFFIYNNNDEGLFFYKEGPTPDSQPIKGEFDFIFDESGNKLSIVGLGFDKIHKNEVRRSNGIVIGLLEDNVTLIGIKRYQKARYKMDLNKDIEFFSNSWPAFHQNVTEKKILKELEFAKETGIDMVFIDDGWFEIFMGEIDKSKFPNGFKKIAEKANKYNIKLGLWGNPFGLDIKHEKAIVWDGAECYDTITEKNNWNWIARTANFTPVETKLQSEDGAAYLAMDLMNDDYYNYIKNRFINFYKEYNIDRFKFDLYQLNVFDTLLGDQNLHYEKYRQLLIELKQEIPSLIISMDVTRHNRPGFDFAQDFGRLFIENRGRTNKDHRYYQPYITLKNLWYTAKYFHPQKLEFESMPQIDDYPLEYILSITLFTNTLYWGSLAEISTEKRGEIKQFHEIYQSHKSAIMNGLIYPIGEMPEKGNWSGFISEEATSNDLKNGYLIIYKNGSKANSYNLSLKQFKDKTVYFSNIYDPNDNHTATGDTLNFQISELYGFKLYKFEFNK